MKEEMETKLLHVLPKANEEFISHCGLKPKNASYIPLHLAQTFPVSPDSTKLSCSLRLGLLFFKSTHSPCALITISFYIVKSAKSFAFFSILFHIHPW